MSKYHHSETRRNTVSTSAKKVVFVVVCLFVS